MEIMSGFPINLDLSEYFEDLRKYSSVFVNVSKCKDVRDVENHVKSVFGLEDNICLTHKKFLIPKSEDIQILLQYDLFKVQKCNFFDLQIHKTKKLSSNSTCEQKALNLTQSEKTIDLSCRPKQRLKTNICSSPGVSGGLALHFDKNNCSDAQIKSPEYVALVNGNHDIQKDKPKCKKKRHLQSDESDDDNDNILDMSVNNSKRKKHINCFSTDDGSLISDCANSSYSKYVSKETYKKSKKRKKHSDGASIDLASTCWEDLVHDGYVKDQSKKKSKKGKDNVNDCLNEDMNVAVKNELENQMNNDKDHHVEDEFSLRKKHKHKKNEESKSPLDTEKNQYYSSTQGVTSKINNHKTPGLPKIDNNEFEDDSDNSNLEERKKQIKREINRMLSELNGNSSDLKNNIDSHNCNGDKKFNVFLNKSVPDNNVDENDEESCITEAVSQTSSELNCSNKNKKRKRKHKRKKANLTYMLAIGPTLNQLVAESKPSPACAPKHVYFPEDDGAVEDMTVPPTPKTSQRTGDSSQHVDSQPSPTPSHQESSSKPVAWQNQLLQLASSGSKPVVFHRNAAVTSAVKTPQLTKEQSTPALNSSQTDGNTSEKPVEANPALEGTQSGKGEVKSDNSNEDRTCSSRNMSDCVPKGLPDLCKPRSIPNDLQNINLDDYPIIDKVVAQDLILFKVWKLNEVSEPGHSKPILARVNDTSNFPDKILLQIIEGCEECSHCTQTESEGSDQGFTIELRWADILEPRLFYP